MKTTLETARELLGSVLVHESAQGRTSGVIVETEGYLQGDPACHAYHGRTERNAPMYGPPFCAYIYFVYGMHYCFNVVTRPGEAVLIRALDPVDGVELMEVRRGRRPLCDGPAKLVQAMGITVEFNGHDLRRKPLYIVDRPAAGKIHTSTRVGLTRGVDLPYRFHI
jgi:DNA-3-methyladenine glycosylase